MAQRLRWIGVSAVITLGAAAPPAAAQHTQSALRFQRELALDVPLPRVSWLSAHNAWNDSGALWANQRWSLETLLAKGIRGFDLDVYRDDDGIIKLCHGDCNSFYSAVDDYERELRKIETFVRANPGEIVVIDIEDKVGDGDGVTDPIERTLGDLLYRPPDKPAGRWPTPREMITAGKRVIVKSANHTYDGSTIWQAHLFSINAAAGWNYRPVKDVNTSSCTMDGAAIQPGQMYGVMDNKIGTETGHITASNIPALLRCGIDTLDADRWSDAMLAAAVWSWAAAEPNDAGGSEDCAESVNGGRWNDVPCAGARPYACQNATNPEQFSVTAATGPWSQGQARCTAEFPGTRFGVPRNAQQNAKLRVAAGTRAVWLALSDGGQEGRWEAP